MGYSYWYEKHCEVFKIPNLEKFGFNPPHTTFEQRINILDGKIDPHSMYGPVV